MVEPHHFGQIPLGPVSAGLFTRLTEAQVMIYAVICAHWRGGDAIEISWEEIRKLTRAGRTTIFKAIAALEREGAVVVHRNPGRGGVSSYLPVKGSASGTLFDTVPPAGLKGSASGTPPVPPAERKGAASGITHKKEVKSVREKREPAARDLAKANHGVAVKHFCDGWERRYGTPYLFSGGKDGSAIKSILTRLGQDLHRTTDCIDRYLASNENFVKTQRHPVALMSSQLQKYIEVKDEPKANHNFGREYAESDPTL